MKERTILRIGVLEIVVVCRKGMKFELELGLVLNITVAGMMELEVGVGDRSAVLPYL
jgi:hypothetical protein